MTTARMQSETASGSSPHLADMLVQDSADCGQDAVREHTKHSAHQPGILVEIHLLFLIPGIAIISQRPLGRAKLVLEGDQAFVVHFGAAEIEAVRSRSFALPR